MTIPNVPGPAVEKIVAVNNVAREMRVRLDTT
jgi:hypothetical protein